ncbi:UNVERIFIED_CONTAM: hypothetical protein K2H54_031529 [Gekko kuhli]
MLMSGRLSFWALLRKRSARSLLPASRASRAMPMHFSASSRFPSMGFSFLRLRPPQRSEKGPDGARAVRPTRRAPLRGPTGVGRSGSAAAARFAASGSRRAFQTAALGGGPSPRHPRLPPPTFTRSADRGRRWEHGAGKALSRRRRSLASGDRPQPVVGQALRMRGTAIRRSSGIKPPRLIAALDEREPML